MHADLNEQCVVANHQPFTFDFILGKVKRYEFSKKLYRIGQGQDRRLLARASISLICRFCVVGDSCVCNVTKKYYILYKICIVSF